MALTSELFNVEVGKRFSNLTNLFYAPTKIPKYISSVATDKHLERVSFGDHDGIRINYTESMTGWLGVRFPLTKKFVKQGESLGYRIEISVDKVPKNGKVLIQLLDNTASLGMYYNSQIELTKTGNQVFTGYLDIPYTGELNEYSIRFTLTTPGNIIIHKPMIIDRRLIPEQFVDSTDYNNEYTRTTMSILKDSFAVKTLNSNGDVLSALNLATGGASLEVGKNKLVVTPETTYIADGTIKKAMIADAQIGTAQIGEIDASKARIINISAKNIVADGLTGNIIKGGKLSSLNGKTDFDLQTGWIEMNNYGVGIKNQFPNRPLQYLVFGAGTIGDIDGSYTALLSNRNGLIKMDSTSAGIQIWNGRSGGRTASAITFYGQTMDFRLSGQDGLGQVTIDTQTQDIIVRGQSLVGKFNNIHYNFQQIKNWFEQNKLGYPSLYHINM